MEQKLAIRLGNQIPTTERILEYTQTKGDEAADLYNKTGRVCQDWQRLLLNDILAFNSEGLWVHVKFGYSVPRRNGKNEVIAMRELWGLVNGEHILHTAHRTSTSHSAWERLCNLLDDLGIKYSAFKAFGKEHIYLSKGGRIEFRTRTAKGGLGEGYDLLVIDEAQEYQDDQESTLKYVVSSSKNPQTIMLGTPPTPISSGTVFLNFRNDVLSGKLEECGWAEWGVEDKVDINDVENWYLCNPSLGTVFTERTIKTEIGKDENDFLIQRLGLWIKYNLKSCISAEEWKALEVTDPELTGGLCVGVRYSSDGGSVSVSIAVKTKDGRTFVEAIGCHSTREGEDWIIDFLLSVAKVTTRVVVDGKSGLDVLDKAMRMNRLKPPYIINVRDVVMGSSMLEPAIEKKEICHAGQVPLMQSVTNSEHRAIGTGGGFGYKSIKHGVDVSIMESAVLAIWALDTFKPQKNSQIRF